MSTAVPCETPPPPLTATTVFGRQLALARRYAAILCGPGVERGLLGPHEAAVVWQRHLLNCAVVAQALPSGTAVADVGSGAGLPGLAWAVARPDLDVTLIEPLLRRCRFLEEAIDSLQLRNARVLRSRAEDVSATAKFPVVTARAVAPLDRLVRWCWPLVGEGGSLLAFKGAAARSELEKTRGTLRAMSTSSAVVKTYGEGVVEPPVTVVVIRREAEVGSPGG